MSRSNKQLLADAQEALGAAGVRGVASKTAMPTSGNFQPGDLMTQREAHELVDLTISESGILGLITNVRKRQRSGSIPKMAFNEPVAAKAAGEGVPGTNASVPSTDELSYTCQKLHATQFIPLEAIREARATGEPDFERKIRRAFGKRLADDVALLLFQGDTTLAPTTATNRLLYTLDGFLKQARNGRALRYTLEYGQEFDSSVFFAAKQRMPRRFRSNPSNRFLMESLLDLRWRRERADAGDSSGIVTGDRALTQRGSIPPLGEDAVLVPQLPTDLGFDTVTASTAAVDSAAASGGGILFNVTTLLGGYAASKAGRRITITCIATGESEEVIVTDTGSALHATTTGTLGQGTVSTSTAAYTVDLADMTPLLYGDPRNLVAIWCDQIRSYSKVEQEAERLRIDVFFELDARIFEPQALVMQDGIALTESVSPWGVSA